MANRARVLIQCEKCKKDLIEFWTDVPFRQVNKMYCDKCYNKMFNEIEKINKVVEEDGHYEEVWIRDDNEEVAKFKDEINAIIK